MSKGNEIVVEIDTTIKKVDIKKAQIKQDLFIKATYSEQYGDEYNDIDRVSNMPIHDDLRGAFGIIDSHMEFICEQGKDSGTVCTGIVISKDGEGVSLIGHRELKERGQLGLVSPLISFSSAYAMSKKGKEFRGAINDVQNEVYEYLFNEKYAPKKQLEMNLYSSGIESTEEGF